MRSHPVEPGSLLAAAGAAVEAVSFYDLAHLVAADVRVKVTFEDLGSRKRKQLERLEALAGSQALQAAPGPGIYPLETVSKADCYVCGYTVDTANLPNQCPRCGAARYSFEQEITLSKAWEIAETTARKVSELYRNAALKSSGAAKGLLESLASEEEELAAEAEKEIAELRT